MVNITLDSESVEYLTEILTQENITSAELVKQLLHDRWLALQPRKTILERMGGYPESLLQGTVNLSDRDFRKAQVLNQVQARQGAIANFGNLAVGEGPCLTTSALPQLGQRTGSSTIPNHLRNTTASIITHPQV
jgi:hypothetical protein